MEDLMGKTQEELKGLPISRAIPQIGDNALRQVLKEGTEYSMFLEWDRNGYHRVAADH